MILHLSRALVRASLVLLVLAGTAARPAASANPAPLHIAEEIPNARLAGAGSYRWFGLKIYDAQLWISPKSSRFDLPAIERFALDLRYARQLQGLKIAAASIDEIKKLGLGSPAQHAAWLARMEQLFPDVNDGNRLTGVFMPKRGARFFLDGKLLGEVLDADFGEAFFAIWLDPKTSAKALRKALLADVAPQ